MCIICVLFTLFAILEVVEAASSSYPKGSFIATLTKVVYYSNHTKRNHASGRINYFLVAPNVTQFVQNRCIID